MRYLSIFPDSSSKIACAVSDVRCSSIKCIAASKSVEHNLLDQADFLLASQACCCNLALARVVIGCGGPYGLSTTAATTTLGDPSVTLGGELKGPFISGVGEVNGTVDSAKVTCFCCCVLSFFVDCKMSSICLNASISAAPTSFDRLRKTDRRSPIALIMASACVTAGCVR